ncbi:hypothetical protein Golob_022025 [Gossypium lobatum]|uniref:ATP-dependent Clp protease proteolytic subunit n=1 Tax=Gossypium lobatum TaxID=34289 RepID=A0A7J8LFH1_9ROSI|nr:hypothetical protein [Gossypium lobatum]
MVHLSIANDTKDVYTICMGLATSMGSFLLARGEITKRLAFPHARCQ